MKLSKQIKRTSYGFLIAFLVIATVSLIFNQQGFKQIEWVSDDFKVQLLRKDTEASKEVLVILVDEASLASMDALVGRWPWPRSVWADLLEYTSMGGAAAVAFDILFTERSLNAAKQHSDHDKALIEMSRESAITVHAMQLLFDKDNPYADRPLPEIFPEKFSIESVSGLALSDNNTFYIPFPGLYQASKYMGVVEFSPDEDGDYRRTRLFRDYQGHFYPTLSTSILMDRLAIQSVTQHSGQSLLQINQQPIPLDREGFFQVNFYEHFETYSIASILASVAKLRQGDLEALYTDPRLIPPEAFENKLIFVGTSAVGLEDMKSTPIHSRWPGVFLHASIASNILQNEFIYQVDEAWVYVLIALMAMLTAIVVLKSGSLLFQTLSPALLIVSYGVFNVYAQYQWSLQIDLVPPVLTAFVTWLLLSGYLSATEGREKARVRKMLAQYVSPAALNTVLDDYENQAEAEIGKEEEMSIVFSDVRSFTTISEGLKPAEVVKMLNIHLEAMTQVTFDYGGTMDKFIGDATMAFWGAPLPDPDHALNATQAAIKMFRAVEDVNQTLADEGINPIAIGVGVNTGKVVLGNIGSKQKLDYTVIGDAVNLGSRLEGLTKQYGVGVLISEFTQQAIKDKIPCALIDLVRVKGKNEPVKIYSPLGLEADEDVSQLFEMVVLCEQGFEAYHQCQFQQAEDIFNQLPDRFFKKFKQIYTQRCQAYIDNPPEQGWDGVFTLTTK